MLRSDWAIYRQGALLIEGADGVNIVNWDFDTPGGNAIFINNYCQNITIYGNHIWGAGASVVYVVGSPNAVRSPSFKYREFVKCSKMDTDVGPKTRDFPSFCTITDSLIHDIGQIENSLQA